MAAGDPYLRERAKHVLLLSLFRADEIRYRQEILRDCLEQPAVIRRLYELAVEGVDAKQNAHFFWFRDTPDALLQKSLRMLELLVDVVRRLRVVADEHAAACRSQGLTTFFAMLQRELDDAYLASVEDHLRELRFPRGALISATLGRANRGTNYVLRRPARRGLLGRLAPGGRPSHSFTIPARDEHGMEAVADLRNRGIRLVASALAQSTDHILAFFAALRAELAFYVGCLNLDEQLTERRQPTCLPTVADDHARRFTARGLYDVALAFHLGDGVVGNDVDADDALLTLITGANQGGKSTFLRSVGIAQLMLQAGMFVGADSFDGSVSTGVFTHFKREEDATMTSGKLDEELARMSGIADAIEPGSLLLCNESFASTNEREGSEIARQVVRALVDSRVRVFFVTHLYDLGASLHRDPPAGTRFLRAERDRTFRLVPGEPLPTSYGEDSYRRVFGG